ncbi:MAG TPA: multicopper oxidase family protein [Solirubrobacterales bacterium]|nr:multicopper oxidase family protein [Solirubrobacterales bacterium]
MGAGVEQRFRRRRFVAGAASGAVALALPAWLRPSASPSLERALAGNVKPYTRRLPIPRELTEADLTLPIKPAEVKILPGRKTKMWTYGGTFPGPTIRRPSGERTTVTFKHRLPTKAGELTVHLHGAHTRSKDDGQPGGLTRAQPRSVFCDISPGLSEEASGNDLLIAPGEERQYRYDFIEDGAHERAAMHWYHDHRLDRTGLNVWRGLAGMWITEDETDLALPLPRGKRDLPLMIADRDFDSKNQLANPFKHLVPPDDGAQGKHVLVNGAALPFHVVSPQRHRLRILNASNFRAYNLAFQEPTPPVWQIATESGLMPQALERERILIGPGERVELIVDFAAIRGQSVELRSVPREDGEVSLGSKPYHGPLMEFRVSGEKLGDDTAEPQYLDLPPLPAWTETVSAETPVDFEWDVSGGFAGSPWKINGKTFSPDRVETKPKLGSVVVWEIANNTSVAHMMHPHHTDWYTLERGDAPVPPEENCLKETFFLDPFERIKIAGKISDYTGKYVMHCHMIDHEDHGLMSQFEVVPA